MFLSKTHVNVEKDGYLTIKKSLGEKRSSWKNVTGFFEIK
jgi:hypothetical protein